MLFVVKFFVIIVVLYRRSVMSILPTVRERERERERGLHSMIYVVDVH
jgi:hypothetical protein